MHQSLSHNGSSAELREGGYYSIVDGGHFSIAKVLKLDPRIVHVRIYKQHFPERPIRFDLSLLTLGNIHDPDGFGMSHLPLRPETFYRRAPVFIAESPVTANELKGYELWLEVADGAVFE